MPYGSAATPRWCAALQMPCMPVGLWTPMWENVPYGWKSQAKRYRRQITHDGVYAEATLLAIDDDQQTKAPESEEGGDEEQDGRKKMDLPPRKCIIFCPKTIGTTSLKR